MKKIVFALLILSLTCLVYAEGDYRGGNGTLLRKETIGDKTIEVIKFEIVNSGFCSNLFLKDYTVYDDFIKKNKIGVLEEEAIKKWDFYEICFIKYIGKVDEFGREREETWIKLSDKKNTGWVYAFSEIYNPYSEDEYSYLGSIKSGSETFHIRKHSGSLYFFDSLKVRDKPGNDSKIVAKVTTGTSNNTINIVDDISTTVHYLDFVAVTEEKTDNEHWYKVEYEKGKYGWIPWQGGFEELFGTAGLDPESKILRALVGM